VSGVGIDHVRCHVISQMDGKDHVIRHVTCLGASEDYTSRHNLESSKIQHVILKTFRDERRIATSRLSQRDSVQREAACVQRSRYNSLYCTNRTSLRTRSMLQGTVYIQGGRKLLEGRRRLWKVTEAKRRLWNLMEVSRKRENSP